MPSIPPSNTMLRALKRHELSSGTFLSCKKPASLPGIATLSTPSEDLSAVLSGVWDLGGVGADIALLSGFTDGAGVGRDSGAGSRGAVDGTEVTMICSPRVMGMLDNVPSIDGRGFGG